jgi:MFS transporter (putative signal transducer)
MSTAVHEGRRISTGRILLLIAGIYTSQSVISSIAFIGFPAVLRASGARLDLVGAVSLLMLPWALKFLWAPTLERLRLPVVGPRRSRWIILLGQAAAMLATAMLAMFLPGEQPVVLFSILAISAVIAATVDIACDGFAIEQLRSEIRGWGNVMQIGGGYFGMMAGGSLLLFLTDRFSWSIACLALAVLLGLLTLPTLMTPEPTPTEERHSHRPSLLAAWARPEVRIGLLLIVLYQSGIRLAQGMVTPLMIDRGFDLATIGMLGGILGMSASLVGTLLAGLAIRRYGGTATLKACLWLQGLLLLGFLLFLAFPSLPHEALAALMVTKFAIMAAGFVSLYTAAMGWSSLRQAGVDFTLFQCADAATAGLAGLAGGLLAQHLGYAACFGLAAGLSAVGIVCLPTLLRRMGTGSSPHSHSGELK